MPIFSHICFYIPRYRFHLIFYEFLVTTISQYMASIDVLEPYALEFVSYYSWVVAGDSRGLVYRLNY